MPDRITSVNNPKVKELVRLQTQPSARRESGLFCVESRRELDRATAQGFKVVAAYVCPEVLRGEPGIDDATEVSEPVLRKIAYRERPEGFLVVLESRTTALNSLGDRGRELLVVCAGLEKPGNIGAILRSADAAGVTGVLIDDPSFDLFNPNGIRASTGAVFHVPVVLEGRETLLKELKRRNVKIIAATPEATQSYAAADLKQPVAIVLGAEAEGLDSFWRDAADITVSIPQRGSVDSLNVSVTAALLMFEAVRQRG